MWDSARCPDDAALEDLASGRLEGHPADEVRAHLAACDTCRRLVAHLVRASESNRFSGAAVDTSSPPPAGLLRQGSTVGRYVVIGPLGRGGMGIVYEAFDPELHRPVALKLLHERFGEASGDAHARLQREARVLARLSHPNVVVIHDVGVWEGGVFLAMERVEGGTLRSWLANERRTWQQTLRIFVDAGRGLAAAHAAGIVHRDFKPENVLIGSDGRARVTDFGLARDGGDGSRAATAAVTSMMSTVAGGTPAYMAPEQRAGHTADARSDQFSFCLALWEALTGERPSPDAPLPSAGRIPARLRRVLVRGLKPSPGERHASMDALLGALRSVTQARTRLGLVAAAVTVSAALVVTPLVVHRQQARRCEGARALLADSWSDQKKAQLKEVVLRSGLAWADDAWVTLERNLDGWTEKWALARTAACEATHVRGEQSEEILAARFRCFQQRGEELDAFVEAIVSGEPRFVERAVTVSSTLAPIDACDDVGALIGGEPPTDDVAMREKVDGVRLALARARATIKLGNYALAVEQIEPLVNDARALGFRPLVAETLLEFAEARRRSGSIKESIALIAEAERRAEAAARDDLVAALRLDRLHALDELGRDEEARTAILDVEASLERLGNPPRLRASLELVRSKMALYRDDTDAGRAHAQRALSLAEKVYGPEHPEVAKVLNNLALVERRAGNPDEASRLLERCASIFVSAYGERHPYVARVLNNRGSVRIQANDPEGALKDLRRALQLREATLGKTHPDLAATLVYLSQALRAGGQLDAALPLNERALKILEAAYGPEHEDVATIIDEWAQVERDRKQWRSSAALYRRALGIREKVLGADHTTTISTRTALEETLRRASGG